MVEINHNYKKRRSQIVKAEKFSKHGEIIKFLKQKHSFTHGFANLVALKTRKSDADSFENKDDLVNEATGICENMKDNSLFNSILGEGFSGDLKNINLNSSQNQKTNPTRERLRKKEFLNRPKSYPGP